MKKVIFLMIVCLTITASGIAWADTSGQTSVQVDREWGETGNQGFVEIEVNSSYDLSGVPSEGRAESIGFSQGEITVERPNADGYNSNSSFGFVEIQGNTEIVSGNGTQNISVTGTVGNQSEIGDEDTFAHSRYEAEVDLEESSSSGSQNGDMHLEGYTYASEMRQDNYSQEVGGFHAETSGNNPSGSVNVTGGVQTQVTQTTSQGVTVQAQTNATINGVDISGGGAVDAFGESFAYGDRHYGEARCHSYTVTP